MYSFRILRGLFDGNSPSGVTKSQSALRCVALKVCCRGVQVLFLRSRLTRNPALFTDAGLTLVKSAFIFHASSPTTASIIFCFLEKKIHRNTCFICDTLINFYF
jgi:hypothetical protein